MGTISVTNGASGEINVSVSTWQKDGVDTYFKITQGNYETWTRNDPRGYLMAVNGNAKKNEYYISSTSKIVIEDNLVKDHGQTINPLILVNA